MKIQFLGTAAAEGWPALFCECEGCRKAREQAGKNIRRRCAYRVDDDTMVDFGPDIYWQTVEFGIDLQDIKRLLISHSHADHIAALELSWRRNGFSAVTKPFKVYGNQATLDRIAAYTKQTPEQMKFEYTTVQPFETFTDGDLTASTILADHASRPELPLNYILQRNGVTALIGHDSGWWCEESWNYLQQFKLDILILECTYGLRWPEQRANHLGCNNTVAVRDELLKRGILKEDAITVTTHFSHNTQNLHDEFEAFFLPKGIQVAYDGMIIEK